MKPGPMVRVCVCVKVCVGMCVCFVKPLRVTSISGNITKIPFGRSSHKTENFYIIRGSIGEGRLRDETMDNKIDVRPQL